MTTEEAKALKAGDRVKWELGGVRAEGMVKVCHWCCFSVLWDDGTSQALNYNEAHYIERIDP